MKLKINWLKRNYKKIILVFILLLVLSEVVLRIVGLGNPVLYIDDKDYEYIYAPNQNIYRFGNVIETNEFGMRSKPINKSDSIVVLVIGDSVLNGGTQVDQDSLATSILEKELSEKYKQTIRVLNISAGSWGPDNAMAFLKKNGTFNAFLTVFVFSSHDYYDAMSHKKIVDINKEYPTKKPFFAISELLDRYAFNSKITNVSNKKKLSKIHRERLNKTLKINKGWQQISELRKNMEVFGYIHPMKIELNKKTYNPLGQKLIEQLNSDSIDFILGMNYMQLDGYRDDIHTNNKGHRILAKALEPFISEKINKRFFLNLTKKK